MKCAGSYKIQTVAPIPSQINAVLPLTPYLISILILFRISFFDKYLYVSAWTVLTTVTASESPVHGLWILSARFHPAIRCELHLFCEEIVFTSYM